MRAALCSFRARRADVLAAVLAAVAAAGVLSGAGCGSLDAAPPQVTDRADLVNDLAGQLDRSVALTYSAQYQLASGETATLMQTHQPPRVAYMYPGGKVVIDEETVTECRTAGAAPTCTRTPSAGSNAPPAAGVLAAARAQGLVDPPAVVDLLGAAAQDPDAEVQQSDTTIAGQHATCVTVGQMENPPTARFSACVTTDGVLGSFSGWLDGAQVEISLVSYGDSVPVTAFEPPARARIIDHRASAHG